MPVTLGHSLQSHSGISGAATGDGRAALLQPQGAARTLALSFFSVCALSTKLVDGTSFGSSVSASSVPKDCSIWAVCFTISAKLSIAWKEELTGHQLPQKRL